VKRYEPSWVELVKALHEGEKVRIIVYNRAQKRRVKNLLKNNGVDMGQVGLFNYPTDDVWIRDNGPIFAFDKQGNMVIEDWKFNGWVSDISSTYAAPSV
jgi:agmatine deiminase